jgi:hypothetical protein
MPTHPESPPKKIHKRTETLTIRSELYRLKTRELEKQGLQAKDPKIDRRQFLENWIATRYHAPSDDMNQPLYDFPSGRIIRIPASELRPGYMQVRVQGIHEIVWVRPEQLRQNTIQHPPFDEEVRAHIKDISSAFAEHRQLSLGEWEDGFRRDQNPEGEIALWRHAADTYQAFTLLESSGERRVET